MSKFVRGQLVVVKDIWGRDLVEGEVEKSGRAETRVKVWKVLNTNTDFKSGDVEPFITQLVRPAEVEQDIAVCERALVDAHDALKVLKAIREQEKDGKRTKASNDVWGTVAVNAHSLLTRLEEFIRGA